MHHRTSDQLTDMRSLGGGGRQLDKALVRLVDIGLAGCIFVVPFLMGGRQALGQLALVTLAVVVAAAWILRQCTRPHGAWRWSAGDLLLLAGAGLLLVQLAPLPPSIRAWLAPQSTELLPLWTAGDSGLHLGAWSQASLTPAATEDGLVLFLAYALLFVTTAQRIRSVEDVERLLRWCALSALWMAAFGLVQFLASNGKFFWVYEHPYTSTSDVAKGSFTNRNHFAHFLALGLGPCIWWIQHKLRHSRRHRSSGFGRSSAFPSFELGGSLRIIGLGALLFAGLLSLSRGGMLVMLLAAVISVAVCYRASSLGVRFVAGLGSAALLIGVALAVFGYDRVASRMDDLTSASIEELDAGAGRRTIWEATAKAIPDFMVLGSGVGSFQQVYPRYVETSDDRLFYTHAENGPLQVTLETGLAGLGLTNLGVVLCAFWCVAGLKHAASDRTLVCVGAVAAALAANVVHSFFDFVWYVPGCMAVVAVMAACACRLCRLAPGKTIGPVGQIRFPRAVGLAAAVAVSVLGFWMIRGRVGPVVAEQGWFRYLRIARAADEPDPAALAVDGSSRSGSRTGEPGGSAPASPNPRADARGSPSTLRRVAGGESRASASPNQAKASALPSTSRPGDRAAEGKAKKAIAALEEVLRWDPARPEAHLRLAESYLALFERRQETAQNAMPLSAISEAAASARFASRQDMDEWLSRAVGEHRKCLDSALYHTRRAISLCPLAGEGYLYLSELCFLEGGDAATKDACIQQALKVRPFHGKVLFHAGRLAALAGDFDQALALWRRAFRTGRVYQAQIVESLAGRIRPDDPQQEIQVLVEAFQPDLHGFRLLNATYSKSLAPDLLVGLRWPYVQLVESAAAKAQGKTAAELWLEAMVIYRQLSEDARAVQCGRAGLAHDPAHYWLHFHLAQSLAADRQFAEAEENLRWCLKRKPGDQALENLLREFVKQRIDQTAGVRPQDSKTL